MKRGAKSTREGVRLAAGLAAALFLAMAASPLLAAEPELLLAQAEDLFYSADQAESVPVLGRVVELLTPRSVSGEISKREREMLAQALAWRAEALFNLGDEERARLDLVALLEADPGYSLDPQQVSPKILDALGKLRDERVGWVDLVVSPLDATVVLAGRRVPASDGSFPVLAGIYDVRVERPGYEPKTAELYVAPGARALLDVELRRTHSVLRVTTRPAGVEVLLDQRPVGVTRPDGRSGTELGELIVEGLAAGSYELLLRREGYRPRRSRVEIGELGDFALEEARLERARGTLRLLGLADDSRVRLNGEMMPTIPDSGELELAPGEYRVEVTTSGTGRFERTVQVADGESLELAVDLRPSLALVGIAAPSQGLVLRLGRELTASLSTLSSWAFLDRVEAGGRILESHGLTPEVSFSPERADVEWSALREALGREIPASLFLLAVLRPESPGLEPDFWFWSASGRAVAPELWVPPGDGRSTTTPLIAELDRPLRFETAYLGARWIDSAAAAAPVASAVDPRGPAAAAGIRVGDEVTAVDGQPIGNRRQLLERLREGAAELTLRRGSIRETVRLEPGVSPLLSDSDAAGSVGGSLSRAVRRAKLGVEAPGVPPWLLQTSRAALLLDAGAWSEAARLLADVDAPDRPGLGQGTVSYWLGVALVREGSDPVSARRALERAAASEGRLGSDDGPPVAPRARVWLRSQD